MNRRPEVLVYLKIAVTLEKLQFVYAAHVTATISNDIVMIEKKLLIEKALFVLKNSSTTHTGQHFPPMPCQNIVGERLWLV